MEDFGEEKQAGIQGQWQLESPARECLEQVKCCNDTDRTHRMMKQGFLALNSGEWEEYKNTFRNEVKVSEWALDRTTEASEKVAKGLLKKAEHRPRNHDRKYRVLATHHASRESKEALRCHTCARFVKVSRWKTTFGGSLGDKGAIIGGAQLVEKKYSWRQPNRLLVEHTGDSVNQAKVFRAHARPQGLCGNLINALKLLANQQEDGDGLIQSIVTNLCEESREGLTNGLREFLKIDDHRALEVGHLNEGLGTFKVRRPTGSEGYPEVAVRESPDDLMLRAEDVGTWKSYINVDHTEKERWRPPLVGTDWHAFCQAVYKGIEGEYWERAS